MSQTKLDTSSNSPDILKSFQISEVSISDKSSKEVGLLISKKIWGYVVSGFGGYYANRNARFLKNRNYANGRIDVQAMFQDRFQFDGKQNYIALNWQTLQIVNRIISGLVGRWMERGEKIQVQATDSLSVRDKQDEYENIEFIIENRKMLEELQAQSGVQIIPQTEIPADKEELNLWQAQFQKIPEEICYELGCNDVLGANGWFDVLKEKMLHDSAEVGFVGTDTSMDDTGVVHVEWIKPENAIYSYSEYPDFRDTSWRGHAPTMKISELRRRYGKEFNPSNPLALTEEQIWVVAQQAKEYTSLTNIQWLDSYLTDYMRPYDEWNVRSIKFEIKTVDCEPYTVTNTKSTGTTYTQKGLPTTASGKKREKPSENQKVIEDSNENIYRGVYLPDSDTLLEWGIKKNMIRPQDPKEIGNAEFSFSFYMYQNYEMRNLAIPQKIEAAVDGMIHTLLKMQQVVARMRPTGAAIDESALQNIDYGLGNAGNKDIDYKKLYDQTGDIYYRGLDGEGNRVPIPIQELANTGFLGQMDGLIRNYQFNYQNLKDALGEDPNLISAALQPRVTGQNVETSEKVGEYATDYMYRAYGNCMKDTARKISCLLKDSVTYGATAYRNIIKQEDIGDRIFTTKIQFLPTEVEVNKFEALLNQAMNTTPELTLFLDPFQLVRVAKEDVKLAETLFRRATKKMLLWKQQTTAENTQATIDGQIRSAQEAEKSKQETESVKGNIDIEKTRITGEAQNRTSVVNMVTSWLAPGADGSVGQVPQEYKPLVRAVIDNIMISAVASTEEQKLKLQQQMQTAREQSEQPQEQQILEQQQSEQPQIAA